MPTPYAKLYASINGGAIDDEGIEIASAATVQFSYESTVGWLRARVEITDYPEGWATPAGWSLAADGTIYWTWTGIDPPLITMDANTVVWGVWMVRLLVNEQLDDSENVVEGLLDDELALSMLSPSGLRSMGAREGQHFTIDGLMLPIDAGCPIYSERVATGTITTDGTPTTILTFPMSDERTYAFDFSITASRQTSVSVPAVTKGGRWRGSATYQRTAAGAPSLVGAIEYGPSQETDAGMDVTFSLSGNSLILVATGVAANRFLWGGELRVQEQLGI
jgi:hypothetical protein